MNRKSEFWIALWVVLVIVLGYFAFGFGLGGMGYGPGNTGYGPWHGWGRIGGWDDGERYRGEGVQAWYGMGGLTG